VPEGELPPLLVYAHGGPTSQNLPGENPTTQFWTSQGFAVVEVNYGGSAGYGRGYRERLRGMWGLVDAGDCIGAARHLVEAGKVDPERLAIRGGSAGGYTVMCALAFHDVFHAGASHFGVSDLRAFVATTHKLESRYVQRLVGSDLAGEQRLDERSPVRVADRLRTPLVVLQGGEDAVVPPQQAELIVAALERNGVPHRYVLFPEEGHGFRDAANRRAALEAELAFYEQVLRLATMDATAEEMR
jgi:dipeptidyl aminopeptidase/acylaminoacyl peptidase